MLIWLLLSSASIQLTSAELQSEANKPEAITFSREHERLIKQLNLAEATAVHTQQSIHKQLKLYNETNATMKQIAKTTREQANRPLQIYDKKITSKLGKPVSTIEGKNMRAQLFYNHQEQYRSYLVKIKLKTDDAMKMVLGGDELGKANTTLAAVKQHKAAVGINAGGYADSKGKRYPIGTTIVDGEYSNGGFAATYADLAFVGMSKNNKLIGGKFSNQQQLDKLKPKFGATFVPVLMKKGVAQTIPEKWKTTPARAPRTVIANYKDDQLLLLVTDGYNKGGNGAGATLAEVQSSLKKFGVVDSYNLDGGGSTTLVFNGKLINNPADGQLRKLPTHFLFFK
ncbi:phosphodiester glycosidase family protein [Paenibacillus yanchengensis]